MKKNNKKTISLSDFSKNFSSKEKELVQEEITYYYFLTQFKELRKQQGISQEDLAQKAEINRTTLSKVEAGSRNATIDTLSKIAAAMGMKLELSLSPF